MRQTRGVRSGGQGHAIEEPRIILKDLQALHRRQAPADGRAAKGSCTGTPSGPKWRRLRVSTVKP